MPLYLVRGRRAKRKYHAPDVRHTARAMLGHSTVRAPLCDARQLSQAWTTPEVRPVNLTRVLQQVYQCFVSIAQRRQIFLSLEVPGQQLVIRGKPVALEWVLSALVDYALNDTPAQGKVLLSADSSADRTCRVIFTTVLPAWRSSVRSSLYSVDRSNHARTSWADTHVGFSTATMLIALHGGTVHVETDESLGTDVVLTLPLLTSGGEKETHHRARFGK